MRDPQRISRICKKLEQFWIKVPDQRFGQVCENYIFGHHLETNGCIFHIEDDKTEDILDAYLMDKDYA